MKLRLAFFLILLGNLVSQAQDGVIVQGALWVRYYLQARLTDKLALHYNVDERILTNPVRQFQFFSHLHLNYLARPWVEIGAGGNFNWTVSSRNQSLNIPEWRPWQEVHLIKSLKRNWQFQFRYRLDERFIHNNDGIELTDGYHFNLRHRLRPQLAYSFTAGNKSLVLRISNEIMFNTGDVKDTFDQNRAYVSIQFPAGKNWPIEIGYMNQYQSRSRDNGFYDRHTIRVTVYHRVDWRRKN